MDMSKWIWILKNRNCGYRYEYGYWKNENCGYGYEYGYEYPYPWINMDIFLIYPCYI